jgi:hypothetical protein
MVVEMFTFRMPARLAITGPGKLQQGTCPLEHGIIDKVPGIFLLLISYIGILPGLRHRVRQLYYVPGNAWQTYRNTPCLFLKSLSFRLMATERSSDADD